MDGGIAGIRAAPDLMRSCPDGYFATIDCVEVIRMSFKHRFRNLLESEVTPYFRSPAKKSILQQFSECRDLWRRYDCAPYQYFKHRLYERDGRDYRFYFPPDVVGRFQRTVNPPEYMHTLSKHETAKILVAKGVPVVQDLMTIQGGKAYDGNDQPLSLDQARDLLHERASVFVKPLIGGVGDNASVMKTAGLDGEALLALEGYVIQPVVMNHPSLAAFHAPSLNTIRFDTLVLDGKAIINGASLKVGTKGARVDNWAKGGIAIGVHLESGRLMMQGVSKQKGSKVQRQLHQAHPETGIRFGDFVVPYWEQACELARQAALAMLPHRSLGWDIAITPHGPIAIEANETGDFFLLQESCGGLAESALCVEALRFVRGQSALAEVSKGFRLANAGQQ
jgi:hypothetical protein